MRFVSLLPLVLAALSLPTNASALTPASPNQVDSIAANDFTFAMYGKARDRAGNVFFSGTSMREALGMAFVGARGNTASEMSSALHLDKDPRKSADAAKDEIGAFARARGKAELTIANRLWADKSFTLQGPFATTVRDTYGAPTDTVDFRGHAEDSRVAINTWVMHETHDKIKDLLPSGSITGDTRLVITNAIWFKGDWQSKFTKEATHDEPFLVDGKVSTNVSTMHQSGRFRFASQNGVKVLEMPYEKSDLAMDFILPDDAAGLSKLEVGLDTARFRGWTSPLKSEQVDISLPKIKLDWGGSMKQPLEALGMKTAFAGAAADFSGIALPRATGGPLYVSDVFHKAFVAIDEKGTEAAAATAVVIAVESIAIPQPAVSFKADHPFLFAVRDTKTDRILFIGRVTNPKA
jgi:serpin B